MNLHSTKHQPRELIRLHHKSPQYLFPSHHTRRPLSIFPLHIYRLGPPQDNLAQQPELGLRQLPHPGPEPGIQRAGGGQGRRCRLGRGGGFAVVVVVVRDGAELEERPVEVDERADVRRVDAGDEVVFVDDGQGEAEIGGGSAAVVVEDVIEVGLSDGGSAEGYEGEFSMGGFLDD